MDADLRVVWFHCALIGNRLVPFARRNAEVQLVYVSPSARNLSRESGAGNRCRDSTGSVRKECGAGLPWTAVRRGIDVRALVLPYLEKETKDLEIDRSWLSLYDINTDLFPKDEYSR